MEFEVIQKGRSIVQKVVDQILTHLAIEKIKVGDILPVETRLAEIFKIGKSTIREAMRILESKGIVEIIPRKGIFIRSIPDGLSKKEGIDLKLNISRQHLVDLVDFLLNTMAGSISLACQKRSIEDIKKLKQIFSKIERVGKVIISGKAGSKTYQHYGDRYVEFFVCLSKASHNVVYIGVVEAIVLILRGHLPLVEGFFAQENQAIQKLIAFDRKLISAIDRQDLEKATDLAWKRWKEMRRIIINSLRL